MLERFYDPSAGRVLLNGEDLRAMPAREYRRVLGLVDQEPKLYTIAELEAMDTSPADRPDIVARVFRLKLKELCEELYKDGIFGVAVAHLHVVEFQKRGLPHAHILIILAERDRLEHNVHRLHRGCKKYQ